MEATEARSVYNKCVIAAQSEMLNFGKNEGHVLPCSTDLSGVHYTFDYDHTVTLPQHARQAGPIYFEAPRKLLIFGVCQGGRY